MIKKIGWVMTWIFIIFIGLFMVGGFLAGNGLVNRLTICIVSYLFGVFIGWAIGCVFRWDNEPDT